MYFFVRFTGIMTVIFGVILMLAGVTATVYGFVQYESLIDLFQNYVFAGTNQSLPDPRMLLAILGLFLFVSGMLSSALGQLLLVFADVGTQTRETNVILRSMKRMN